MWRKPNEELNPKNLLLTVKHRGGDIMVWGYLTASGTGNLVWNNMIENNMDQYKRINILKENSKNLPRNLEFKMHSNCIKIMIPNIQP